MTANFTPFQLFVYSLVAASNVTPAAFAEHVKTGKLSALEGFVEQTPKFDTRVAGYKFQLGVDTSVFRASARKNLLKSKVKVNLLKAKADQFYLQTTRSEVPLKAQTPVAASAAKPLQGKVDKNGQPSPALTAETPRTPLTTYERDVHAPFSLDLDKILSKVAPDLSSAFESEISEARVRSSERAARELKAMEPQLNARLPHPEMPSLPSKVAVDAKLTKGLDSEVKDARTAQSSATASSAAKMDREIEQSEKMKGQGWKFPDLMAMFTPQKAPPASTNLSSDSKNLDRASKELDAQMAQVHRNSAPSTNIDAEISNAKNKLRTKIETSQSNMDSILTHARNLPHETRGIPNYPTAGVDVDAADLVPWDAWHSKFSQLAKTPILSNVSKLKIPSGANTVQITVTNKQEVTVVLIKPGNQAFDSAIVSAYKSLDKNPELAFPRLSRRQSISFVVDNEHQGKSLPTSVESQPNVGDQEIVKHHL